MIWPWSEMLLASTVLLGILTSIILLVNKYPSSRYLGKILISQLLFVISFSFHDEYAFQWPTITLLAVVLFLYSRAFFIQNTRINLKHVLPVLAVAMISFTPIIGQVSFLPRLVTTIIVLAYLYATMSKIRKEGKARGISWFENPGSRLIWFRNFITYHLLLTVVWIAAYPMLSTELVALGVMVSLGFVYFQIIRESAFLSPIPIGNKYQKSTLTPEQKHSILGKLDEMIKAEKFYLKDDVSLSNVATQLNTTTHHLSQVINESKGITFQKLIARYRIEEAKILLRNKKYDQTTIENIAEMVGYNSKSAFNTTFKKHTGLTPTDFRESGGVRSYREEHLPERNRHFLRNILVSSYHVLSFNQMYTMVPNFLKIFSRTLAKNKVFSAINLFGLTVGFSCCILIYLFISDELSYDRSIKDYDRIYRVAWMNDNPQTRTPHPMALAMAQDMPEVEAATSISPWYGPGLNKQSMKVEYVKKDLLFEEPDFYFADSTFFEVFDLEVLSGDKDALRKPWGFVITDELAKKIFGDDDPLGQELIVDEMPITVNAVVKGMPKNSHFHFQSLLSYVSLKTINPDNPWFKWEDFGHFNYIKTKAGTNHRSLEAKIPEFVLPYVDWSEKNTESLREGTIGFELQPIADIHLNSRLRWELENNGNVLYVYILAGTFVFLLLIVVINYVNLTTAKSLERAKEVGIRKTLGAIPRGLKIQFYTESLLFSIVALILAFCLSLLLLEAFSAITHKIFLVSDILNTDFLTMSILICLAIAFLAGFYPAFTLSAFEPSAVLKGQFSNSSQGNRLRSILVIMQFVVSAILITGSLIILKQIDFMKSKELGFDQEAVVSIKMHHDVALGSVDVNKLKTLQDQLATIPGVLSTSAISNLPGEQFDQNPIYLKNIPDQAVDASELSIDFNAAKVLNFEMLSGRDFDKSHESDIKGISFIVNETFAKQLNLTNPIGEELVWKTTWNTFNGEIVGVVKDFHYRSLHEPIQPLIIRIDPEGINHLIVKLEGQQFQQTLSAMKKIYEQHEEDLQFEYCFLDQQLAELYGAESRTLNVFSAFAAIALFLACLGLLGMAIAMLNQKIKEVGIRKIMGASSQEIIQMILGQFTRLISIALVIGIPAGYLLTQEWLNEFPYKVNIGFMPFIIAATILFLVAIASVSAVVMKIAYTNPADTLRYE